MDVISGEGLLRDKQRTNSKLGRQKESKTTRTQVCQGLGNVQVNKLAKRVNETQIRVKYGSGTLSTSKSSQ